MKNPTEKHRTAGELFVDGLIELVRSSEDGRLALFYSDLREGAIESQITIGVHLYVPEQLHASILAAMPLPEKPAPFESLSKLVKEISQLTCDHGVSEEQGAIVLAFCVLATWVLEALPFAPQFQLVGPDLSVGIQVMRLLQCLCRHSLPLATVGADELCYLPAGLHPTLLIRQTPLRSRVRHFLNDVVSGGRCLRNGQLIDLHSAIGILTEPSEEPPNPAVLQIPVEPSFTAGRPILDGRMENKIAAEFQNKLLAYRRDYFHKVDAGKFDCSELAFPLRNVATILAACAPDHPDLQSKLIESLRGTDQHNRLERSTSLHAVVIEAFLYFLHDPNRNDAVHIGAITEVVNTILRGRGGKTDVEPRKIGHILRNLGFRPDRLDSAGRGVLLLDEDRKLIHKLAWDLAVPSTKGAPQCDLCRQFVQQHQ